MSEYEEAEAQGASGRVVGGVVQVDQLVWALWAIGRLGLGEVGNAAQFREEERLRYLIRRLLSVASRRELTKSSSRGHLPTLDQA